MAQNRSETQAVWIGPNSSPSTASAVAAFNESSLAYPGALGQKYRIGDKWYQLVQLEAGALMAVRDLRRAGDRRLAPLGSKVASSPTKTNSLVR